MKTFRFKTNLQDTGDLEELKSYLSKIDGIVECYSKNNTPKNILFVKVNGISSEIVAREIFNAGFRNELVNSFWSKKAGKIFKKDCCK